ncbi:MAG: RNA-binding protein [Acidimicrobiia bacterium]
MNIYVGNLPYTTTSDELRELFSQYGQVDSAGVIMDRDTGRSRGFGFVEMPDADGTKAIDALNQPGAEFGGRSLNVNEARPRAR